MSMDGWRWHRRTVASGDMFRMLQSEAPLGPLLRRLRSDMEWPASPQTAFEPAHALGKSQWQAGSFEKPSPHCVPPIEALSSINTGEPRSRRSLTPGTTPGNSGRANKTSGQGCPKFLPDVVRRPHEPKSVRSPNAARRTNSSSSFPAVASSGFAMEANSRYRTYMEDVTIVIDPYILGDAESGQWGYYAVYDGHGGRMAVDYAEANLHSAVFSELKVARRGGTVNDARVAQALQRAFTQIDDYLKPVGAWKCGCTATVALLHRTPAALRLHVANVGDSRAIVIDGNLQSHRISFDHRPTDVSEGLRIEAEGGFISRGRVNGQLGVSRALGDHWLKMCGVTGCPCVASRDVTDDFALVIASDGLWDVLQECDVVRIVENNASEIPEKIADVLVRQAQRSGSTDNISCLVCLFNGATGCESN